MTVGQIIKKARTRLGDADKTGWSDDILIDFVDQGQKDLCKMSRIYKRTFYLGLLPDTTMYPLPDDCFQVDRIEHKGENLPVLSREDQDSRFVAKGLHVIKSDLNMGTLEISEPVEVNNYAQFVEGVTLPEPESVDITIEPHIGVPVATDMEEFFFDSPIGVITGFQAIADEVPIPIEYGDISGVNNMILALVDSNAFGVVTALDLQVVGEVAKKSLGFLTSVDAKYAMGSYGICTDVLAPSVYFKVYYSAISATVNSLYDALVVKDLWEKALIHYVVGMARQDDNDEGNYALGTAELEKFGWEVKKAMKLAARSYTSSVSEIKETQYRRV